MSDGITNIIDIRWGVAQTRMVTKQVQTPDGSIVNIQEPQDEVRLFRNYDEITRFLKENKETVQITITKYGFNVSEPINWYYEGGE